MTTESHCTAKADPRKFTSTRFWARERQLGKVRVATRRIMRRRTLVVPPMPLMHRQVTRGHATTTAPKAHLKSSSPLPAWQQAETSRPGFPQFERLSRELVLAQFPSFASAAEPPSLPPSLVRREQPQVDVNGHPPRSKSARSDSSRMGEQGTHLLLLGNRLRKRTQEKSLPPPLHANRKENFSGRKKKPTRKGANTRCLAALLNGTGKGGTRGSKA